MAGHRRSPDGPCLRRPGRPGPPRDHRPPQQGAGNGQRAGRAVRHHPSGRLEAHRGPRAGGAGDPDQGGPASARPPRCRGARGAHRVDRPLPAGPRAAVPPPGRRTEEGKQGGNVMTNALTVTAPDGLPYIDTGREFDAPVDAVFRAYRDPDLLKQWLGPNRFEMEIERHDFVTQGGFRWTHRAEDEEYRFNGVFHTVRDNELAI